MEIRHTHRLTERQSREILALTEECNRKDGSRLSFPLEEGTSFFLLYDPKLSSVMALVSPALEPSCDGAAVLCSAFTLPSRRRRGYFTALFDAAAGAFQESDLLFWVDRSVRDTVKTLESLGAEWDCDEHLMELSLPRRPLVPESPQTALRTADGGSRHGAAAADGGSLCGAAATDGGSLCGAAAASGGLLCGAAAADGGSICGAAAANGGSLCGAAAADGGPLCGAAAAGGGSLCGAAAAGGGSRHSAAAATDGSRSALPRLSMRVERHGSSAAGEDYLDFHFCLPAGDSAGTAREAGSCRAALFGAKRDSACFYSFEIDEALRGRGLGKEALALALIQLGDCGVLRIILHVSGDNRPALALYQKAGFRITETLSCYLY